MQRWAVAGLAGIQVKNIAPVNDQWQEEEEVAPSDNVGGVP